MLNPQITVDQDRAFISGELTFATVGAIWDASQKLFPQKGQWNCDFSQVTVCDSACLALLVEWIKLARKRKVTLRFIAFPQQLRSIAAAAKLNQVLDGFNA